MKAFQAPITDAAQRAQQMASYQDFVEAHPLMREKQFKSEVRTIMEERKHQVLRSLWRMLIILQTAIGFYGISKLHQRKSVKLERHRHVEYSAAPNHLSPMWVILFQSG